MVTSQWERAMVLSSQNRCQKAPNFKPSYLEFLQTKLNLARDKIKGFELYFPMVISDLPRRTNPHGKESFDRIGHQFFQIFFYFFIA